IPARVLVPMLKDVQFGEKTAEDAKKLLLGWDHVLDGMSVEAGIYAMWEREILKTARERFIPEELKGLVSIQLTKIIGWLQEGNAIFGEDPKKGRQEFLGQTFSGALATLETKLGKSPLNWKYGQEKYKHVQMEHILSDMVNDRWKEKINVGPLSSGGNSFTPNVTGSYDNQYHGATFRLLADTQNWDNSLLINSPGQSADPESPYYKNLFGLWAGQGYFPAYFTKEKVEGATKERLVLRPKGK